MPRENRPAYQKKVKNGKKISRNRNTFHRESLKWVSDKAENASQSINNPLASGSPHTTGRNGSAPASDSPHAPMAYRLGHPRSLKYTILYSIEDSGQVYFLSLFVLTRSDEKRLSPQNLPKKNWALKWWKINNCALNLAIFFLLCPNFYTRPPWISNGQCLTVHIDQANTHTKMTTKKYKIVRILSPRA